MRGVPDLEHKLGNLSQALDRLEEALRADPVANTGGWMQAFEQGPSTGPGAFPAPPPRPCAIPMRSPPRGRATRFAPTICGQPVPGLLRFAEAGLGGDQKPDRAARSGERGMRRCFLAGGPGEAPGLPRRWAGCSPGPPRCLNPGTGTGRAGAGQPGLPSPRVPPAPPHLKRSRRRPPEGPEARGASCAPGPAPAAPGKGRGGGGAGQAGYGRGLTRSRRRRTL